MLSFGAMLLICAVALWAINHLVALPEIIVIVGQVLGAIGIVLIAIGILLHVAPVDVDTGTETLKGLVA